MMAAGAITAAAGTENGRAYESRRLVKERIRKNKRMQYIKNTSFRPAYKRAQSAESTVQQLGSQMTFLAESKDTGGSFAVMEFLAKAGHEPAPHLHEREDEWLYVLEGEIEAYVDAEAFSIKSGGCVFLPKLRPHVWSIKSPRLRALMVVQPAGLERYFRRIGGLSATGSELPGQTTYSPEDPAAAIRAGAEFGLRYLSPEKTAEALPLYSGFALTARNLVWMDRHRRSEKIHVLR
jgi:quercetin dioxygenase-like cupin family protein